MSKQQGERTAALAVVNSGYAGVDVLVIHDTRRQGYTATVNEGIAQAKAGHLLLLNDDCLLSDDWLSILLREMERRRDAWFVGPSGRCRTFPQNTGRPNDKRRPRYVDHLAGFCLLVHPQGRRLLTSEFVHYGSDVDLQWDAQRRGGRSLWIPEVYCSHGLHDVNDWWERDQATLKQIWGGIKL